MWVDEIMTQFVRDRIRETHWKDHGYVYGLHLIEAMLSGQDRRFGLGFAFHMSGEPKRLFAAHPAESECIRVELEEKRYVDPATFHRDRDRFKESWEARERAREKARQWQEEAERRALRRAQAAERRKERAAWRREGGLP